MVIAFSVSISPTIENGGFIAATFDRITKAHLQHTFIFIVNKPFPDSFIFSENLIPVVVNYSLSNAVKWLIWHYFKIPASLRKYKAHLLISEKSPFPGTQVPQILIAPSLPNQSPAGATKKKGFFYNKPATRLLHSVKKIIATSEFEKAAIIKRYKLNDDKVEVIYEGVNEHFHPINIEERETLKQKYADGNEFFVYAGIIGPPENLLNLLKAFSAFRKRQKSNMQLIMLGDSAGSFDEFKESMKLYRFKKEVKLLTGLPQVEAGKIIASSYAMVYPPLYGLSAGIPMKAMKCEVPAIISLAGAMPEICGEAALYVQAGNYKDIAEKMMEIFKDEKLRKVLIEKGIRQVQKYNWEKSADALWQRIEKDFITRT